MIMPELNCEKIIGKNFPNIRSARTARSEWVRDFFLVLVRSEGSILLLAPVRSEISFFVGPVWSAIKNFTLDPIRPKSFYFRQIRVSTRLHILRVVQTIITEINVGKSRFRHRTTLNLNDEFLDRLKLGLKFKFRIVMCRIRLFPTLISEMKWLWSEVQTLNYP